MFLDNWVLLYAYLKKKKKHYLQKRKVYGERSIIFIEDCTKIRNCLIYMRMKIETLDYIYQCFKKRLNFENNMLDTEFNSQ